MSQLVRDLLRLLTRRGIAGSVWWSVLSRVPVYLMTLAIMLVVREQGGDYTRAGLLAAVYTVGMAAAGPMVGRVADRRGHRLVLAITGLAFPGAVIALAWWFPPASPGQVVFAGVAGMTSPPAVSCMRVLWSHFPLSGIERAVADLWEAVLSELVAIGSPALLSFLMLTGSARTAISVAAGCSGIGALGLAAVTASVRSKSGARVRGRALFGSLQSRGMVALVGIAVLASVPIGLLTLAIVAFAGQHGVVDRVGLVYACWGVGSVLGALWLGRHQAEVAAADRFPRLLLVCALGAALPALAWSTPSLAVALAIGGAPLALVSACQFALVRAVASSSTLTEAFTWVSAAGVLGDAVGQQLGGWLVDLVGAQGAFGLTPIVTVGAAVTAYACRSILRPGYDVRRARPS